MQLRLLGFKNKGLFGLLNVFHDTLATAHKLYNGIILCIFLIIYYVATRIILY